MATATQLAQLSGAAEILADSAALAAYEVDELRPSAAVIPNSAAEVGEIIRLAAAQKLAIIPCAGRTKLSIGAPPTRYDVALDFSRMNRVLAYDPRDLTLGVEPGIKFAELAKILAAENQFLPLAPPYSERATIGGILAANVASPLRQFYGGPRDFVLGMEFVTGYGAQAKSGGRVVKNVTGYDLHKLLIGSLGTLAVITRVNFKTFPLPPAQKIFRRDIFNFRRSSRILLRDHALAARTNRHRNYFARSRSTSFSRSGQSAADFHYRRSLVGSHSLRRQRSCRRSSRA